MPSTFDNFLAGLTQGFTPVIEAGFAFEDYVAIDLSEKNRELPEEALSSSEAFENFLQHFLKKRSRKVAFGGYDEKRGLYQRSVLFSEDNSAPRNIHLGIDIWAAAGTAVLAVLKGKLHSFRNNNNLGDYGPTIILEHELKGIKFYSLYGHLSRTSLEGLSVGQEFQKGQKIAVLGTAEENGDYAPHLHFQIIRDMGGKKGDFPGVCSENDRQSFLDNCPDPNLLLKLQV
ncbi:MAG: peptidoglycan DD-metalloendopeptidase family protein [Salinimicrobium sp.]